MKPSKTFSIVKILLITIMILGIAFSISNFLPERVNADTSKGEWEHFPDGTWKCMGIGTACKITDPGNLG